MIGVGPGDAELLTLRAVKLLGEADVVIAPPGIVTPYETHVRPGAEIVEGAELGPGEADKLALKSAKGGRKVARLYPGDPLFYCKAADLAVSARKAEVPFEIAAGVPVPTGVASYAGTPLVAAGQGEVRTLDAGEVKDWSEHAASSATLAIMFGEESVPQLAKELIAGGRAESTPVAVTSLGTTTRQATVSATLKTIAAALKSAGGVDGPATIIVGEGAGRREALSWFETRPLFGWRVLVPRTKEQSGALMEQLRSYGAVPEQVPTISVEPPRTPQQMERAVKGLVTGRYQWVAFTSTNAVRAIRERFEEYGLDARAFAGVKVAAVGEQTAAALVAFGIQPDLVPDGQHSSEGLLEVWPPYDPDLDPLERVLLPRADIATETLVAGITELGWEVEDVTAYRTVRAAPPPAPTREAIKGGGFDAVLFTSSSTVRNLVGIAGKPHAATVIGVIGPQTAKTAEEFGLRVDVHASRASASVLAAELATYGAAHRQKQIDAGAVVRRPSQMRRGARRRAK
ncbi:MAG: bifunctional uroporphyrinogen-III C-methyltransferase/uroporphyrinogen-III synthase [Streptosporangiales bacterium]|nr:bifunctional uroporphyrinogen-III C-methyltransferase/uroporphyrinogen-III synthase [Streptosporangiales bacterium]